MATANSVITRAMSKLGVKAAETPLEAVEIQDGLDLLNDMLIEWEGSGILLGCSPLNDDSDELRVPRFALGTIKDNLAVRMAPEYKVPVPPSLAVAAENSFDNLLRTIVKIGSVAFPDTLPKGTGNCEYDYVADDRFFPLNQDKNF